MDHLEAISQLDARRDGALSPASARALEAHLADCADCRLLASRWPAAGLAPDLRWRVMGALRPAPARGAWAWPVWGAPLAGAAALLLLLTAFWRPERAWVDADAGFAATERPAHMRLFLRGGL